MALDVSAESHVPMSFLHWVAQVALATQSCQATSIVSQCLIEVTSKDYKLSSILALLHKLNQILGVVPSDSVWILALGLFQH